MRRTTVLSACATVALLACTSENGPTEPEANGAMTPADPTVAAAVNIWRERGPHPFGTVMGPSIGVLTNPAGQSVVYAFGGCDAVNGDFGQCTVRQISIYNVATDTWSGDHGAPPVWRSNGVGAIGGKLYSSGGYPFLHALDGLTSGAWAYDPATRQVTFVAPMPRRTADGVTGVIGGKLYVLPGLVDFGVDQLPFRRLYRYDPATNTWGARKLAPHYHPSGAGGVIGGKFYVVGGRLPDFTPVADLDVYDPATDTWKTLAPIPKAGRAIGTALGGKLYVVVGTDAYVYNPGTNRWSAIADPTWGHDGVVRVVINGKPKLLAVGLGNTEVYTP